MADEALKTNGFSKQKVQKAIKDWKAAEAVYDAAVDKAEEEFSVVKSDQIEMMKSLGIKPSVFRATITKIKLTEKSEKLRDRFAEHEDVQDQFDNVLLAAGLIPDTAE